MEWSAFVPIGILMKKPAVLNSFVWEKFAWSARNLTSDLASLMQQASSASPAPPSPGSSRTDSITARGFVAAPVATSKRR